MSTDRAEEVGIKLAELTTTTVSSLNAVLPPFWSHANPVDILGDATPERYKQALEICLQDKNIDGILTILTPQAMTNPTQVAQFIIDGAKQSSKPVLASWTGGDRVQEGRDLFAKSRVAHFNTPEVAVDAFSFLTKYHQNQKLLKQIPSPIEEHASPDIKGALLIIERILSEGRQILTTQESKAILAAFNIPVTQTIKVSDAEEAMIAAETMGFPVVLKLNMVEFTHKSDVGGVRLNINSVQEIAHHFHEMESLIKKNHAEIDKVIMTVEPMYNSFNGRELMIGMIRDPVFGPAISFGLGGTMVEVLQDKAVALPPLNEYMVKQMIAKTKAAKYLHKFRQLPEINCKALVDTLLNVSTMVSELSEIVELDINPLIADDKGVMAVDARIKVQVSHQLIPYSHMAIHPYPHELISNWQLPNG
ncbi:MAG: acetate--CoA ligase family protein, partial [Proteobacteria bacterium]|nr:acetate--CoA ligase family protein [Pseudomonadota bacterium]